ncbi:hypothetical protein [Ferrovibrio sp.]|uniref:hypothetical protein n=1 Tax=Ferrovibrio sp. TaxID=1917215 RepID=UPI003D0C04F4
MTAPTIEFLADVNAELSRHQSSFGAAAACLVSFPKPRLRLKIWAMGEEIDMPAGLTATQIAEFAQLCTRCFYAGRKVGGDNAWKQLRDLIGVDRRDPETHS